MARWAEKVRRAADLEHWAAFRRSFERLGELLASVGRGEHADNGRAPATICVLSGDVHHAYVAELDRPADVHSPIYQLTCSPLHNFVPPAMKITFRVTWSRVAERFVRAAAPDRGQGAAGDRLVAPAGRSVLRQRGRDAGDRRAARRDGAQALSVRLDAPEELVEVSRLTLAR